MIRYDLRCENGHAFEAWFRDSAGFDAERAAGRVICHFCGDDRIEKALMAPAVASTRRAPGRAAPGDAAQAASLSAPEDRKLREALATLRRKLETEADYVGKRFATEARRIHDGETEARAIWGEATLEDAKALIEDGAPIRPLPPLPKRND